MTTLTTKLYNVKCLHRLSLCLIVRIEIIYFGLVYKIISFDLNLTAAVRTQVVEMHVC